MSTDEDKAEASGRGTDADAAALQALGGPRCSTRWWRLRLASSGVVAIVSLRLPEAIRGA